MKWPFARHTTIAAAASEPARPAAQSRRDWATLPPLKVAGGRAISLTARAREFTESLVTQQVLVHTPRLEHVRQIDAPSGSFRGVLAPVADHAGPELQEASPLPSVEHRHVTALSSEPTVSYGQAAIAARRMM